MGAIEAWGEYIERLHREHPSWNRPRLFNAANSLHMNFYEDWLESIANFFAMEL